MGAVAIFVGVMVLLVLALRRRRPQHSNAWIWIAGGGIAFPVVVLSALLAYSTARSLPLQHPIAADVVIEVSGVQWWWEVRYRDSATGREIRSANEIRVPVGRSVLLGLTTADVIHSFWVPALWAARSTWCRAVSSTADSGDAARSASRRSAPSSAASSTRKMALHVVAEA